MCILRLPKSIGTLILACSALLPVTSAHAESFPNQPIRLIVPFAPGGGTDAIARTLAERLNTTLGANVVVENRPGAGSSIGSDMVARSKPDGYTLLLASTAHAINPTLMPHLPYDSDAFTGIALVGKAPNIIVVRPDSPIQSVSDLVKLAKEEPGKLTYGTSGNGTSVHLTAEMFSLTTDISLTHVPYRGAGPAINDLIGGQIDMAFVTASAVAPIVKQGQLRALALTQIERSPAWPGVPTVAESGYPDYFSEVWYAIYAASGTPTPVVEHLNKAINEALQSPEYKRRTEIEGLQSPVWSPAQVDEFTRSEQERWGAIIKQANVQSG